MTQRLNPKIKVLPDKRHFDTIEEMKNEIVKFWNEFKFPIEKRQNALDYNSTGEHFEAIMDSNGKLLIVPDFLHLMFLYRGQSKDYGSLVPLLYRATPSKVDVFLNRLRSTEFELLIKQHPVVKNVFLNNNFKIDYVGLAQHYGLKTEYLDCTSDLDTAIFFACSKFSPETNSYIPRIDSEMNTAVLYVILPFFSNSGMDVNISPYEGDVSVIGFQPFERSGNQKAFAIRMNNKDMFFQYVKFTFNFTNQDAIEYHEKFEKGRKVWNNDIIDEKARIIKDKLHFNFSVFNIASRRYCPQGFSKTKLKKELQKIGVNLSTRNASVVFDPSELISEIDKWNKFNALDATQRIRKRYWFETMEDGSKMRYEFRTTKMMLDENTLRLIGNQSGIHDEITDDNERVDHFSDQAYRNGEVKSTGWIRVPERFISQYSQPFLKFSDCYINPDGYKPV